MIGVEEVFVVLAFVFIDIGHGFDCIDDVIFVEVGIGYLGEIDVFCLVAVEQ